MFHSSTHGFPPRDENALGTISADGLEALSIAAVWDLAAVALFAFFRVVGFCCKQFMLNFKAVSYHRSIEITGLYTVKEKVSSRRMLRMQGRVCKNKKMSIISFHR